LPFAVVDGVGDKTVFEPPESDFAEIVFMGLFTLSQAANMVTAKKRTEINLKK